MNPRIFGEKLLSDSNQFERLQQCIVVAHTEFVQIHNRIMSGKNLEFAGTIQVYSEHLDTISEICAQNELYGLQRISSELNYYLSTCISNSDEYLLIDKKIIIWLDNILVYLDKQDDLPSIQALFEPLPPSNTIFLKTVMGWNTNTEVEPLKITDDPDSLSWNINSSLIEADLEENDNVFFAENFHNISEETSSTHKSDHIDTHQNSTQPESTTIEENCTLPFSEFSDEFDKGVDNNIFEYDSESDYKRIQSEFDTMFDQDYETLFAPDEEQTEYTNIHDVLQSELAQLSPEIIAIGSSITSSGKQSDIDQAIQAYTLLLERIMLATETIGLTGIHRFCEFVLSNVKLSKDVNFKNREKMSAVLSTWPHFMTEYLKSAQLKETWEALTRHSQEASWLQALTEEESHDLYMLFVNESETREESTTTYNRQTIAHECDVSLHISSDVNPDLMDAFFIEAPGQAEQFTRIIAQITNDQNFLENILENIQVAQRLTHTLKGSANLIGAKGVANLAHHIEDILEHLASKHISPPEPLCEILQESADCIELMIEAMQDIGAAPSNSLAILQGILDWANRVDQGDIGTEETHSNQIDDAELATNDFEDKTPPPQNVTVNTPNKVSNSVEMLRVPVHVVDEMLRILGEISISISQTQERGRSLQQLGKHINLQNNIVQQQRFELENLVDIRSRSTTNHQNSSPINQNNSFDTLEMDQYDDLYRSTHKFIETVSDSGELSRSVQSEIYNLDGLFLQQQQLNKELQQIVMTTRMISVKSICPRLQRTVRQAAKLTNKKIELEIIGNELLIDSNVLNKLVDPLMHMLRNAVDHGIETADERLVAGKPTVGLVTLTFIQYGNNVRIYCADDGRGLDYARINEKAASKGLIGENDILSKHELGRIILHPGFSTRDSTTQISGRGVGMDVVHTTILSLKGTLAIQEGEQAGTLFVLDLPISLVTNHSLVVTVENKQYAIPSNSLEQILPSDVGRIIKLGETSTYHLGKNVYTINTLRSLLGGDNVFNDRDIILIAKIDNGNVAIAVDKVVNSYDLVTKNTGDYIKNIDGIAGVSVLGDGSVVPVLDLPALIRSQNNVINISDHTNLNIDNKQPLQQNISVLIVDDSLSMRKSLTQLVEDIGYHAIQARDGLEAVSMLENHAVHIALIDMEMPRMNGIELTTHIRASENNNHLPIIMITSRTQQIHRQKATAAGVTQYLTKPYNDDTLMNSIASLLSMSKAG